MDQVSCSVNTSCLWTVQLGRPLSWAWAQNMETLQLVYGNNPNMTEPSLPTSLKSMGSSSPCCLLKMSGAKEAGSCSEHPRRDCLRTITLLSRMSEMYSSCPWETVPSGEQEAYFLFAVIPVPGGWGWSLVSPYLVAEWLETP